MRFTIHRNPTRSLLRQLMLMLRYAIFQMSHAVRPLMPSGSSRRPLPLLLCGICISALALPMNAIAPMLRNDQPSTRSRSRLFRRFASQRASCFVACAVAGGASTSGDALSPMANTSCSTAVRPSLLSSCTRKWLSTSSPRTAGAS